MGPRWSEIMPKSLALYCDDDPSGIAIVRTEWGCRLAQNMHIPTHASTPCHGGIACTKRARGAEGEFATTAP